MKPLSDFYPRILSYAPSCPTPFIAQALVDAAIEFCSNSMLFRVTLDPITVTDASAAYAIPDATYETTARVLTVRIDDNVIQPVAVNDTSALNDIDPSLPQAYYPTNTDGEFRINLFPAPDGVYSMKLEVVRRPKRDTTYLQDDLYNYWMDAVVYGALSRILSTPGQSFTDPGSAMMFKTKFDGETRRARIEGSVGRVRATQGVRLRGFA